MRMDKKGQVNINGLIGIVVSAIVLIFLLIFGLQLFNGLNTAANYALLPASVASTFDLIPTVFAFAIVLSIIIVIFGLLSFRR